MCILKMFKYSKIKKLSLLLLLSLSPWSFAVDYSYYLDASYEDSNNITQLVGGEEGQGTSAGFGFILNSDLAEDWNFNMAGDFETTSFSQSDLQTQQTKSLEALGIYKPQANNFSFIALADISQIPANRFQTQQVNNIRDQYAYAVKPGYFFALTSTDRINIEYTYVDIDLENVTGILTPQNSSNITNNLLINYEKRINATNSLSLNVRSGDTDFDEASIQGVVDYKQDDVFLRWVVIGETNQLQLEYGFAKIKDELQNKFDQDQKEISFTRQINQSNSFSFNYSDRFGNALNTNQATNTITINQQNNLTTAQAIEDYSFIYNLDKTYFSANLGLADSKITQVGTDNTEKRKTVTVGASYILSRVLESFGRSNIQFSYLKSESDFDTALSNFVSNEIETYSLTFNYVYSSKFVVSLGYSVRDTKQLDLNFNSSGFDSKGFLLSFNYSDRGKF